MQGIKDDSAIGPDIPVGGKRKCVKCKEHKEVHEHFSTVIHTLKNGTKKRYWRSRCKDCSNKARRGKSTSTWWKEEISARDKAGTRLIRAAPSVFLPLFKEELLKEYKRLGLTAREAEARLAYRTRYVKEYIRKIQ